MLAWVGWRRRPSVISAAYENKSLKDIVFKVAARRGLFHLGVDCENEIQPVLNRSNLLNDWESLGLCFRYKYNTAGNFET